MKTSLLQVLLVFAVLVGAVGCNSTQTKAHGKRLAAIAVVMEGGGTPTSDQIAAVHANMRPAIARLGYVLSGNPRMADVVIHVKFTPHLNNGDGGRISILNVAPNADERQKAYSAREDFKESSAKAIRSQMTEPR